MLVSLDFVKIENLAASGGQLFGGATQRNAIDGSAEVKVIYPNLAFRGRRLIRCRFVE
jgi:hypothetical protein